MSKIEEVATAIYTENPTRQIPQLMAIPWGEISDCMKDTYLKQAQAAIDALGVIILPKDAEPEMGDVVKAWKYRPRKPKSKRLIGGEIIKDYFEMEEGCNFESAKGSSHFCITRKKAAQRIFCEKYIIIQRNGKPVIYEEE